MPMLGSDPWTMDGKTYIRRSLAVERGMQVFWTSKDGGYGLLADYIGNPHPELVALGMDTIVLHPLDYEAVKKSMQEQPKRDRARDMLKRSLSKALQGFDPVKHFRDRVFEEAERKGKDH